MCGFTDLQTALLFPPFDGSSMEMQEIQEMQEKCDWTVTVPVVVRSERALQHYLSIYVMTV